MKGVNFNKAGMEGLDAKTINSIIFENSKNSKFYDNEIRRGSILKEQIDEKLVQLKTLTPEAIKMGEIEADKILDGYREQRLLDKCIVHIDMDAFYAAVEMRDDPSLRLKPLAVGGDNMLSTSNYLARRFGVRAAMPGFLARKLCPDLTIVPPDFIKYTETSRVVRSVLGLYAGVNGLVTMSLDEAYVNITDHLVTRVDSSEAERTFWPRVAPKTPMLVCHCKTSEQHVLHLETCSNASTSNSPTNQSASASNQPPSISRIVGKDLDLAVCLFCGLLVKSGRRIFGTSMEEAVRELRFRVFCATKLTCSAGIAANSLIAKIASDWNKPNGQYLVDSTTASIEAFILPLPIRKVPGIGHVTECRLRAFGVQTIRDLFLRRGVLYHLVSSTSLRYFMRITLGFSEDGWTDSTAADTGATGQKSMSIERTFQNCSDQTMLLSKCRQLCSALATDMKEAHVQGKTVTVKLKLNSFELRSRSQTLPDFTCSAGIIHQCASDILNDEIKSEASTGDKSKRLTLRLLGIRMSNLVPSEMCQNVRQVTLEAAFERGFGRLTTPHEPNPTSPRVEAETLPIRDLFNVSAASGTDFLIPYDNWRMDDEYSRILKAGSSVSSPSTNEVGKFIATCPVCLQILRLTHPNEINSHLDICLSRQTVLEAVRDTLLVPLPQPTQSSSSESVNKRFLRGTSNRNGGPLDKYFKRN